MASQQPQQINNQDGVVKWFDARRGFGFLIGPDRRDVFVHFSVIDGGGFKMLKDGSRVNYDAVRTEKGWKATRVAHIEAEVTVVRRGYTRSPRR
jgi:cold shock protein